MTATLRIFVSSVQKELEDERLIVQNLVNTDPFLSAHCIPVLYEFEPASPDKGPGWMPRIARRLSRLSAHRGRPVRHACGRSFHHPCRISPGERERSYPFLPSSRAIGR